MFGVLVAGEAAAVDELGLEVATHAGQDERTGKRWPPALLEDRELEPFDVAVRGRSAGTDPPLVDLQLGQPVDELVGAELGAVVRG